MGTRLLFLVTAALANGVALAQTDVPAQLRVEETRASQLMPILHHLTDIYGPRLTGSPQLRQAQEWAAQQMRSWGLKNVELQPWEFGRPGWHNRLTEISVTAPFQAPVLARALPWTPSTNGLIVADAVILMPPGMPAAGRAPRRTADSIQAAKGGVAEPPMPKMNASPPLPTRAELLAYLESQKEKVRGAIVLVGPPAAPEPDFIPQPMRRTDAEWMALINAPPGIAPGSSTRPTVEDGRLTRDEINATIAEFLVKNGALARVKDGGERRGLIRVESTNGYGATPQVPGVTIANSDYGRIARVLQGGTRVEVRMNVQNELHPDGSTAYNVVADLPGTDKSDEIVMIGAHIDGWATASGAADDAVGAAVMMEAMRLLKTSGLKPRRTIRIALWGGEEQGVYGSQAYVARHFGSFEHPKPGFAKLSGYINLDHGTGRPRAATYFGPQSGAAIVAQKMASFRDWGFMGANTASFRPVSDSAAFYLAGLPSIGLYQDPFDYLSRLHHTNFDTYEEVYEPDVRIAAVEVAALAFALANDDKMLPRFDANDIPSRDPAAGPRARIRPPENHGEP
ncbi:M20/M25/M40 family metallo-hydrolase [Sphingopyxis sp. LARHCG72]